MPYKKMIAKREMPSEFHESTIDTVTRIETNSNVMGIIFFHLSVVKLCTVPESMAQTLATKLPVLTSTVQNAIGEIDVLDELVAYRIVTNKTEIMVVVDRQFAACVVHKVSTRKLKKYTASLNTVNPIVDRIMEDDSVEGVIMTNKEGVPVLTNMNVVGATNYGLAMRCLGYMTHRSVTEIDPFDEVLVLRIKTKKLEVMVAPYSEFNIVVMQHARTNKKVSNNTKKEKKTSN